MPRRVDARDVLDADATTSRAFSGRVVGVYRRSGPNAWDDYVLVDEDGGSEAGTDLRSRFLKSCVRDEDPTPEGNLAVWLHGQLDRKPEPND